MSHVVHQEQYRRLPWMLVVCPLALMLIGLTGIDRGDALVSGGQYFTKQAIWMLLAIPALLAATWIPYRVLKPLVWPLFFLSLVLLVAVYFLPARNGSRRWIPLGPVSLQPSELAKLAFILALSRYLMFRRNYRNLPGLLVPFAVAVVPVGLILREPDLGTALVFIPVLFAMLFAAGARPRHLISLVLLGVCLVPVLWMGMSAEQKSRVVTLLTQVDGGPAPRGDGYPLHQSKQVLALGGPFGSEVGGMAVTDPFAYHLPAARTDFVFCLIGERWGFGGCALTLGLYLALIGRGLAVAAATREPFGRLVAVGIVTQFATQAIINAGMTVGLMPITGLTLPLLSYGGSSLVATCFSIGLLINIGMRPGYEMHADPFRFDT